MNIPSNVKVLAGVIVGALAGWLGVPLVTTDGSGPEPSIETTADALVTAIASNCKGDESDTVLLRDLVQTGLEPHNHCATWTCDLEKVVACPADTPLSRTGEPAEVSVEEQVKQVEEDEAEEAKLRKKLQAERDAAAAAKAAAESAEQKPSN